MPARLREKPSAETTRQRLDALRAELRSDAHYEQTDTLAYGATDPFEVALVPCERCGGQGELKQVGQHGGRWQVACSSCGFAPPDVQRYPWQALLEWNMKHLANVDYRELPLFGLQALPVGEARKRLSGIRRNLELRKGIAELEAELARETGSRPPGKQYQQRIDAYLRWAMYGLRLVKVAGQRKAAARA